MQPEDLERVDTVPESAAHEWLAPDVMFAKPEEEREPFWDYFDLLLLIGLVIASLVLANVAAFGWLHFHPELRQDPMAVAMPLQYLAYGLIYLSFYFLFKFKYDRPVLASLRLVKTGHNLFVAGAGGVLLAFGIALVATMIKTPKVDTPFDQLVSTPLAVVLLAVTAIVAAPLIEEMMFRGFLQPLLSRTFGNAIGILSTAVLFGGLHASEYQFAWQYVAAISTVGIALGVLRVKTNSILPGTVMHGCFNAVSVVGLIATKFLPHK